jgi:hypothetical protein
VELDPVKQCVVLDGTSVSRSAAQGFESDVIGPIGDLYRR